MATATPAPTPNPNALRFTLDVTLPQTINCSSVEQAAGSPLAAEILIVEGVASVFGANGFITVTRVPGADWGPITAAVQAAVEAHL